MTFAVHTTQIVRVGFTNTMVEVNSVEWLRCQHRPATNEYNDSAVAGRESCSMMGVRPLLAGDSLRIIDKDHIYPYVVAASSTYFGIVKLNWCYYGFWDIMRVLIAHLRLRWLLYIKDKIIRAEKYCKYKLCLMTIMLHSANMIILLMSSSIVLSHDTNDD